MPILRAGAQLIYYAHVPKCGGSAVEHYLMDRFGTVAFNDSTYMSLPAAQRWSKTSPQHIDAASLGRLFPAGFFDQAFTVVRHPVARVVSAYHFQKETERSIPEDLEFAAWLEDLIIRMEEEPFVFDNHTRPMAQIVPEGAEVFYLEHGLDAMVPWLDQVTGTRAEPRALKRINERGAGGAKVQPSPQDLSMIAEIYAEDFTRFGYDRDEKQPKAPAPELPADVLEAQAAEARHANSPVTKAKSVLKRVLKGRS